MVRILEVKQDKRVVDRKIDGNLRSYQEIVGGYVERIVLTGDAFTPGIDLVINEEGLLQDLPNTICIQMQGQKEPQPIAGPCFFIRHDEEGDWVSLTYEDIKFCMDSISHYARSTGPMVVWIPKEDLEDGNVIENE